MISCQPKRSRESNPQYQSPLQRAAASAAATRSAGGDYEGAEYSDNAPPLPVVSKVFHLAGTVGTSSTAAKDQAKLIEEIRVKGKPSKKPVIASRKKSVASSKSSISNNNDECCPVPNVKNKPAFKAVLRNRDLGDGNEMDGNKTRAENHEANGLKVFDVVMAEERAEDELDAEYCVGGSAGDVITCNDVPMVREDLTGSADEFVYDLYYSTAEGAEAKLDLSFLDAYLDVKPYRNEDLDALENYGIVEPASMLQRGFLGVEDEDSNEEDNWRNDYPDTDPEDTFDREEEDYDQCGIVRDAVDEVENVTPAVPGRDDYISDMLRVGMRLRNEDDEDDNDEGDDEEDHEDVDSWDVGNPKESRAYLEYKKRTMAQLNIRSDDEGDEDEEDDDDVDDFGEGLHLGIGRREEKINYYAFDEKLDKDSESDSFENYDDD